jgi:amidase
MNNTNIGSAKELAEWNRAHADLILPPEYPNQDFINKSIAFDHMSNRRQELMDHITAVGKSLPDAMAKYDLDVVIGPADSWFSKYSAATGNSFWLPRFVDIC